MEKFLTIFFTIISLPIFAQITIDVNTNFKHAVGGIDSLDRSKVITIHEDTDGHDWDGWNFQNWVDLRDTVLNYHDAYMGRNTGFITWQLNQVAEDPNKPGYADTIDLANRGQNTRNTYANQPLIHQYEAHNNLVIAGQHRPYFPDGTPTGQGWIPAGGTAIGEYMARYVNYFYGGNGQPAPAYVEIMNEPLWEFVTTGNLTPTDVFDYHIDVADAFRQYNTTAPLGGYVAAFPDFEKDDFQRWENRMKLFMDMCGSRMDFWSIHLYDMNAYWSGGFNLRRGANIEATFDMMDHYSQLSFNEIKPYVISEYGGRALNLEHLPWSPYRDWMTMKSFTPMLLTFLERPQDILSSIPFVVTKAPWGTQSNGNPHPWRLMRQDNELAGQTGQYWVFTEMIKFYQMWKDVKGMRVDAESTDPDIQTNAFVNDDKLYVILSNLYFQDTTVHLNIVENNGNVIQNIRVKHLHLNSTGTAPLLDDVNYTTLDSIVLGGEGAMVLEYTFQSNIVIDELVDEVKYFADKYYQKIIPYANHTFYVNGVTKGNSGEVTLRLGLGREHGLSLKPTVKINGYEIEVPDDYQGYNQFNRDSWFGVIDVPVPFYYLQTDNKITVQFDESGGYISSIALRVFNHSNKIHRSDSIHVASLTLVPATRDLAINDVFQLTPTILPIHATDHTLIWSSSNENIATVDSLGQVSAIALGTVTITATALDGGLTASSTINVLNTVTPVLVNGLSIFPETYTLNPSEFVQLNPTVTPIDADDKSITWTTLDPTIASVDSTGMVQGLFDGTTQVIATTNDGSNLSDTSTITVQVTYSTSVQCFFLPSTLERDTIFNIGLDYSTGYPANAILELRDANNNIVASGQLLVSPGIGTANIQLHAPTLLTVGTNYSLHGRLEHAVTDSIMANCSKNNIEVTFPVNTYSIEFRGIKLFPNPTDGELALEVPYIKDKMTVTVFDINGRLVHEQIINQTLNQIDLQDLSTGMYLLKIANKEMSVTERIIVR